MNILLVGSGGREHALAWKIAQSPLVRRLVIAPGNPGMDALGDRVDLKVTDADALTVLAREMRADLVVVGPETALEAGLADRLTAAGIPCFGPSAKAARLETSKAFSKAFMERHEIPTAGYGVYERLHEARQALTVFKPPYVIKADGLAAGKGVAISPDKRDAEAEIERMLGGRFGTAGARVVIEEFMDGEEGSLFAVCDGQSALLLGGAQDHKRAFDGDLGPNTGGMGSYSPAPVFTPELVEAAERLIVQPVVAAMAAEGAPYRGVLYAGLMATAEGPRVVEFNARFGDPECQVLMMRMDGDIVPLLLACAKGDLTQARLPTFSTDTVICVVLAAKGYPDSPLEGSIIRGAEQDFGPHVQVFHAGTKRRPDGQLAAAGGRVLNVCARGRDIVEARERAYAAVRKIDWPGGFHRTDIGWRAVERD
ncbi:MAG: phosphoribosylamine--glycine ligase [Brevundimonas sp.]|uniref:phosphoribosylamine--glycine ligase n=1 Tax=Brevundimonas sp. TaxID=1871086 RepID=UPI001A252FB9|nr:phosphoribosylamine--glycine ligase [Brevundimonas sp.]MBJ7447851.1 phosphoribosylamine--glycine ligase [Brevundimonas sp.]